MIAAGIATWVGVRGVFGITAVVYIAIAGLVLWAAQRMRERQGILAPTPNANIRQMPDYHF